MTSSSTESRDKGYEEDDTIEAVLTLPRVPELVEFGRGAALVQHRHVGLPEDLEDLVAQLLVGLVDVALGEDVERGPHQRKQRRVEVHRAVSTQWHVHRNQSLDEKTLFGNIFTRISTST